MKTINSVFKGILLIACFMQTQMLSSQSEYTFTKSFTDKLEALDLEFFYPVERWLKAAPLQEDDYAQYDLVLHSPPDIELRIDIDSDGYALFPNVEVPRILASLASNEEDEFIEYTIYPRSYAQSNYGAEIALFADFTPKPGLTHHRNARLLCLYKEGYALIKMIILYDDHLDPYFKMPMRFRKEVEKLVD